MIVVCREGNDLYKILRNFNFNVTRYTKIEEALNNILLQEGLFSFWQMSIPVEEQISVMKY